MRGRDCTLCALKEEADFVFGLLSGINPFDRTPQKGLDLLLADSPRFIDRLGPQVTGTFEVRGALVPNCL